MLHANQRLFQRNCAHSHDVTDTFVFLVCSCLLSLFSCNKTCSVHSPHSRSAKKKSYYFADCTSKVRSNPFSLHNCSLVFILPAFGKYSSQGCRKKKYQILIVSFAFIVLQNIRKYWNRYIKLISALTKVTQSNDAIYNDSILISYFNQQCFFIYRKQTLL